MSKVKIIGWVIMFLLTMGWSQDYSVIINVNNPASSIDKATLRRIFLGKMKQWQNQKIIPINLPESEKIAQQFIDQITRKDYGEYKKYWVAQQIKGAGSAPMEQKTSTAVKLMVSEIPGAIAYIPKVEVDNTVKEIPVK